MTQQTFTVDYGLSIIDNSPGGGSVTGNDGAVVVTASDLANTAAWTFDPTGNLTLPSNTASINYANGTPYGSGGGRANTGNIAFSGTSIEIAPGASETNINISPDTEGWAFVQLPNDATANTANTRVVNANGNVTIETGNLSTGSSVSTWAFDNTGGLTLPGNLGANNASITSINDGQIVKLSSQDNGYVGITGFGSAGNNVAAITAVGLDGETDRVIVSVYNPNIDDGEAWTFNNAGDFTTASGNIFFGTDVGGPVIVPGGIGVKIAADRSDLTTSYVNITTSGITIDAIGGSTADITLRAADDIILRGGDKTSAPGQRGGDINIEAGQGGPDTGIDAGDGGDVNIIGGFGGEALAGGPGRGGDVAFVGGPGSTANVTNSISAGRGGAAIIQGGDGGQNADAANLSAQAGNVEIYGGLGSFDSANGVPSGAPGHVNLYGGNWGFISPSGNIYLNTYQPTTFYTWTYNNLGQTIFPTLSTARGDTTGGTITGSTIRIGDGSQEAIITTPDGDAITQDSPRLVINPGKGADLTAGEGGDIYLWAGRGGSGDGANAVSGGSGGDIKIRGGQGGGVNGAGGYIRMEAGDGAYGSPGDSGAAGFIEITGGTSGADRNGGYVRILAGQGDFSGGDANITGGVGQAGPGGPVNITGGTSGNGLAEYGNVNITSGASTWRFDNAGVLTLPGEGVVRSNNDTVTIESYDTANAVGLGFYVGTNGGLYFKQGANPNWLTIIPNASNAEISSRSDLTLTSGIGTSGAAGNNINITAGAADQSDYYTTPGGNVNITGGLGAFNDGGGGGPGGSINISAGNSSDPAGHPGNVTVNTGPNTWNFDYNGTLNLPEGTAYIGSAANALTLHANDSEAIYISAISGGISAETNGNITLISNVDGGTNYAWTFDNTGSFVFPGGGVTMDGQNNALLTSGLANVTIGTFVQGADGGVSWEYQGDGSGNSSYGAVGLDTAGTANTANLQFKVQLVSDQGNVSTNKEWIFNTAGNLTAPGAISAIGNVTATNFIGNGAALTSITGANVTGTVANATAAFNLNGGTAGALVAQNGAGATGFITIAAANTILTSDGSNPTWTLPGNVAVGTVTANAQPNITSVGTLTSVSITGNVTGGNLRTAGLITATGNILGGNLTVTGNATITYTPATAVGYGITVNAANTQGGTGYADFLRATNTSGGATNPNKSFRLSSAGALEIINSAYSATLLSLSDTGAMSAALPYQVAGKQAVNGPAFSAYAAAILQNIPNGTQTKVLFQTEEFDTNSNYASSRFTPTVEGYYQLNAEVRLDGATGTGECMIILYKNGSEYKRGWNSSGTQFASSFWAMQVSSVAYANGTGDYFEIYVQQGSGGTISVTAVNAPAITWFNGCMLRGA